jgi:hypothetical protein
MTKELKPVIVTVTDEALGDIQKVAAELGAAGMKVNQVLPVTGVISGSCAPRKKSALQKIGGVLSVEDEAVAKLQ